MNWDDFHSGTVPSNWNLATRARELLKIWNKSVVFLEMKCCLIHELTLTCHFGYFSVFLKGIYRIYHRYHDEFAELYDSQMILVWFSNRTGYFGLGTRRTLYIWSLRSEEWPYRQGHWYWYVMNSAKVFAICKLYTPENLHGTQKSPIWKGKSSSKPSFLGSMLIFQGVFDKMSLDWYVYT